MIIAAIMSEAAKPALAAIFRALLSEKRPYRAILHRNMGHTSHKGGAQPASSSQDWNVEKQIRHRCQIACIIAATVQVWSGEEPSEA
ncbi:hypothetical protein ACKU27_24935 [Sphingobium yanoikuyae]|uniref:hypothetical protein n=1 Tax=Sphingobium yanoikuyae TaxID=13690 RepID=UPI002FDD4295